MGVGARNIIMHCGIGAQKRAAHGRGMDGPKGGQFGAINAAPYG